MYGIRDEPEEVELLFEPEAGRWVTEVHWHKSQQAEHLPDGSVRFRITIPVSPDFVGWVLSYGDRVRVMGPSTLADRVAEEHRRAAAQYEI
jgi:predicted DNA-binding transcriptional regulator YafY